MQKTLFLLFSCCSFHLYGQAFLTLEGQVVDPSDAPVAYAHVALFDDPASDGNVVTNEEGFFLLHLAPALSDKRIAVTAIGYQTLIVSVRDLTNHGPVRLVLQDTTYQLTGIEVSARTPAEILREAIDRIDANYPAAPFTSEAFFRTAYSEDGTYVKLLEASLQFHDRHFVDQKPVKAELRQIRKSNDYSEKVGYENNNWLYNLLESGLVVRERTNILDARSAADYNCSLETTTFFDERKLYVIQASLQQPAFDVEYELYIDAATLAFVRIDYKLDFREPLFGGDYDNLENAEYYIASQRGSEQYERFGDRYYPKTAWRESFAHVRHKATGEELVTLGILQELLVHQTEFQAPRKIQNPLPRRGDLYYVSLPYHQSFWDRYNRPVDTERQQRIRTDLEREEALEVQFRKNGEKESEQKR